MLKLVAFAVHLEDVDVVCEAVEERAGEPLRAEHLGPLVERQVGRDQGRAALITDSRERLPMGLAARSGVEGDGRITIQYWGI